MIKAPFKLVYHHILVIKYSPCHFATTADGDIVEIYKLGNEAIIIGAGLGPSVRLPIHCLLPNVLMLNSTPRHLM